MTTDPISITRLSSLHPVLVKEALTAYSKVLAADVRIRIVRAFATFEEQAAIYAKGRTAPGPIVSWAEPGHSWHNYGMAIDFCLLHENKEISWNMAEDLDRDKIPDWMEVVDIFRAMGWKWGGSFTNSKGVPIPDNPHLQKTFGMTITEALAASKGGQIRDFSIPNVYQRIRV